MNRSQSLTAIFVLITCLALSGCGPNQAAPTLAAAAPSPTLRSNSAPTWSALPSPTVTLVPPTATPRATRTPTLGPTVTQTRPTLAPTLTETRPTLNPTETALAGLMIKWLDNLKTCAPYTVSFPNPLMPAIRQTQTIKGPDGNLCLVTYETSGKYLVTCRFSPEGIKAMTADPFYEDIKNNRWQIAYNSAHNTEAAKIMNQECKVAQLATSVPTP